MLKKYTVTWYDKTLNTRAHINGLACAVAQELANRIKQHPNQYGEPVIHETSEKE